MTGVLERRTDRRRLLAAMGALGVSGVLAACTGSDRGGGDGAASASGAVARPAGWTEDTHGNKVAPNYDVVFPEGRVNEMKVTVSPEAYKAMLDDMTALFGQRGSAGARGGFGAPPGNAPAGGLGGGGQGGPDFTPENPIWVPATVEFNGKTWTNVGFRFKGNSTLRSSWSSGSLKMPFKMDFDQFEDQHPETKNQRFYGFKQLSLANGQGDPSFLRERTAYQLLEEAGLAAAKTAYYELTLDFGEGPKYLGVYVVIEVVDDTVVKRVFGDAKGNIYEADGNAASLAAGTQARIRESFQKENNEDKADWSDIEALYNALHSPARTSNPSQWRPASKKSSTCPCS